MVGDRSWAMWSRTAIFLVDLTGMEISVPSGLKNWSICSAMGLSVYRRQLLLLSMNQDNNKKLMSGHP